MTEIIDPVVEYLVKAIPPSELWRIMLVTLATFASVQAVKYVSRFNPDRDGFGPAILRGVGVVAGPAFAFVFWPVRETGPILAIGLIGWILAHLLAVYGLGWLQNKHPVAYRMIEAKQDRREIDSGPPKDVLDRRKKRKVYD